MLELYLMIAGMMLVTAVPRIFPAALFSGVKLPPFWRRFLNFIPYTTLGALIFPAILFSTESLGSALFGAVTAVTLALLKPGLLPAIAGATLAVLLWELLIIF